MAVTRRLKKFVKTNHKREQFHRKRRNPKAALNRKKDPIFKGVDVFKEIEPLKNGIIVLDGDDFYGITIELILEGFRQEKPDFNAQLMQVRKIDQFKKFSELINSSSYNGNLYFINDIFADEVLNAEKSLQSIVSEIREKDKNAEIFISTTLKDQGHNIDGVDGVIIKSGRDNQNTLVSALSGHYNIDYTSNTSDPEYDS